MAPAAARRAAIDRNLLPVGRSAANPLHAAQGRLNQWAHWARAQGPRIFFLFEGPLTGCGEIFF